MDRNSTDDRIDLLPSLLLFWRWKFWILAAVILAGLTAYIVAKQIAPLYESHATLLPSNTNSRDKQLEEFTYGYEIHSERLIQLLSSDIILDSLEAKYDLAAHYKIDMSEPTGWDKLQSKARNRIQFHKTRYSSVVISVTDENPVKAAQIANDVGRLVNVINAQILKVNASQALDAAYRDYEARLGGIRTINDSINNLQLNNVLGAEFKLKQQITQREVRIQTIRTSLNKLRQEHQIFDYGYQINILNEEIADARAMFLQEKGSLEILKASNGIPDSFAVLSKARMMGAQARLDHFESNLNDLSKAGTEYSSLLEQLEIEKELLVESKEALDAINKSYEPQIKSRGLTELEADYDFDQNQIRDLKRNYQRALGNYLDPVPIAHIISYAHPSYKKIYPKTLFGIILSVMGTFFMALVLISILDKLAKVSR